jgi:hypothetical protein
MRIKPVYILFLFFIVPMAARCGDPFDTTYIKVFKENYTVVADIYNKKINFSLKPLTKIDSVDSREIKYMPNVDNYLGITASYKGWGLGISFKIPNSRKNDSVYGKTEFMDYRFSLHRRKFGAAAFLRYYKGFYLNNPSLFDTAWKSGVVPHRDDLEMANIGFGIYYLFNNKQFSMRSIFSQSEKQLKTAATFLMQLDANGSIIHADSSLIPASDEKHYFDLKGLHDIYNYSFCLLGGYAHCNVVHSDYYICPMLYVGPGYQHKWMYSGSTTEITNDVFFKTDFKFAAGYNAGMAYLGVLFDAESNFMPAKNVNFKTTVLYFDFFVGYRFW